MKYKVTLRWTVDDINVSEIITADGFRYEENCLIFWKGEENDFVKLYSISNIVSVETI